MEDKHNAVLPGNLSKMLALQLKNSAAKGKLTKVKASYKLYEDGKKKAKAPAGGGRKKGVKATPVKKMTPAKAKQPKSIKSPAAKRARRATA
ncbi:histone H1-like [Bidens hawaiensis]|uniref:histone H1-like n=1 Tax=Bidens hawaiensis TaxID=980011 RepID=UPI00404B7E3D